MSFRERARRMLADIIHKGPEPWKPPSVAKQPPAPSAEGLRAKERADHKAWLRDNADSVTVPEHPAVALLRAAISFDFGERGDCYRREGMLTGDGGRVTVWEVRDAQGARWVPDQAAALREFGHDVAILAGSKPGERALSEVLAEARAAGYDEALQKAIAERNAMYSAHELGALADELDEDNYATAAKKLRAAIATIARLEAAAKEERAKGREEGRAEAMAQHGAIEQAAFQAGKTHGAREAFAACETIVKDHPEVNTLGQPLDVAGSKPFLIAAFRARGQR